MSLLWDQMNCIFIRSGLGRRNYFILYHRMSSSISGLHFLFLWLLDLWVIFTAVLLIKQQLYLDFCYIIWWSYLLEYQHYQMQSWLDSIVFTEEWSTRNLQPNGPQGALEEHLKSDVIYKLQCTQFTTNLLTPRDDVNPPTPSPVSSRPGWELAERLSMLQTTRMKYEGIYMSLSFRAPIFQKRERNSICFLCYSF